MGGMLQKYIQELESSKQLFDRSTSELREEDSSFAPTPEMLTVAQQVAHVAQTLEWFAQGATRPEGFDLDFEGHMNEVHQVTSLAAARDWFDRAHKDFIATINALGEEGLKEPLPEGMVMGGEAKAGIVWGVVDHNAHHRGALTVYARLMGRIPPMPYM